MSKNDSKLLTKVSSLIPGQVPDFVESDHSLFVKFLKDYYQYLEAGRLTLTATVNYISLETTTVSYVLSEDGDDNRIVTEIGEGSLSKFIEGETITGGTSNATATVLVDDIRNSYVYITSQQKFITGETVTGTTSGSYATVSEYRANPIQNIQQLLEYANVDNTIFDFLEQFRKSFMTAIPSTLASGVSKRNLIKNIKDLYAAKGTSEAIKLFSKIFLGEEPEIFYPNQYLMKLSDGNFGQEIILKAEPDFGVDGDEVVNQSVKGQLFGATATVISAQAFRQGNDSITELVLGNVVGTFRDGERITGNSTTRDVTVGFTVKAIVSSGTVTNDGILHSEDEDIAVENIGNGFADVEVAQTKRGSVSGIEVDDAGTKYEVGDTLTFTSASADLGTVSATGFVSMVGGGIQLETATLDDPLITTDSLILETGSFTHMEPFNIVLESVTSDTIIGDGSTTEFTLTNVNTNFDSNIVVTIDNVITLSLNLIQDTVYTLEGQTLTFTTAPVKNSIIRVRADRLNNLLLDGTDSSGTDAGHTILTEEGLDFEQSDTHTTLTDQFVLESATLSATEAGAIQKAHVASGGEGYTDLPSVTITTTTGTGASLLSVTNDIGAIQSVKVKESGFRYSSSNPPELSPIAHFVVKDVSGTFSKNNTLTSHVGTVQGFNSDTNILDTTFENVIRVEQEQDGTFNQGIELEDGNVAGDASVVEGIQLEDEQDFEPDEGDSIVLDGTEVVTPPAKYFSYKVKVVENTSGKNVYAINDIQQPVLTFTEGNTYYFDLSDNSLYNAVEGQNHLFRFSSTSDGTHGSGSEYTTGVTKSASYIEVGTTEVINGVSFPAFIQITLAEGAPTLYYYCGNHSGMGARIETREVVSFVRDENDGVILDGSASTLFGLLLEDSLGNGFLREEGTTLTRASRISLNGEDTDSDFGVSDGDILLEDGSNDGETSFILKEGSDTFEITGIEDAVGGNILLERSTIEGFAKQTAVGFGGIFIQDEGGRILIDRFREVDLNGKLLLDGVNSDGVGENEQLASENAGRSIILDGTDADGTDSASKLLFEDETGDGDIVLDGTDSDSSDVGDNIINESPIDFSNKNVTITDSSGASAIIVKADIATVESSVATISTSLGEYTGIQSLLGEDLNRLQDSYYYQDYSYEVRVGAAFSQYVNELQKSDHPAGFKPFGKVSIASAISVAVTNTGAGVQSFIGDDRFSPILGSTFATIFDQTIQRRIGTQKYEVGGINDQIIYEDGIVAGDRIILDATSSSTDTTTPANISIILEDSLQPSNYDYAIGYIVLDASGSSFEDENGKVDLESGSFENEFENILLEDGSTIILEDGFHITGDSILFEANSDLEMPVDSLGGRMMSESSLAPSDKADKNVVKHIITKISTRPTPRVTRNLFIYLANTPFGRSSNLLQLENSTSGSFESGTIVLDGHAPLNEGEVPILLEGDEDLDHIILETGSNILMEDGNRVLNEESGFVTSGLKDRLLLERGGVVLAEADRFAFPTGFVVDENENLVLEDHHSDTETLTFNDFGSLRFEEILKPNKIIMELGDATDISQVILLEDDTDGHLNRSRLVQESGGFIDLEENLHIKLSGAGVIEQNNANAIENVGILLEDFGRIQLDGTDVNSAEAGDYLLHETTEHTRFTLELSGSIIEEEFSSNSVIEHLLLEGESGGRILYDAGQATSGLHSFDRSDRILLEQGDGDIILLDGIDSDSTDAGRALLFESFEIINTAIALETTNKIPNEGQIPIDNWTLNSRTSPVGGLSIVQSSEIRTRTTGDIALEDGLGNLVLNGTDGSSTNAGDNMDLEGATGITI